MGIYVNQVGYPLTAKKVAVSTFPCNFQIINAETQSSVFDGVTGASIMDESAREEVYQIDFSEVEILLVGYGMNDYHAGERIYPDESDSYNENTYVGALRSGIRTLQRAYPELEIVLMTPTYSWYPELGLTCEEYIIGDNELADYVNATIYVAEELGIRSIDVYHLYKRDDWEKWKKYTEDGLHPNQKGREKIAGAIVDFFLY